MGIICSLVPAMFSWVSALNWPQEHFTLGYQTSAGSPGEQHNSEYQPIIGSPGQSEFGFHFTHGSPDKPMLDINLLSVPRNNAVMGIVPPLVPALVNWVTRVYWPHGHPYTGEQASSGPETRILWVATILWFRDTNTLGNKLLMVSDIASMGNNVPMVSQTC